jgi:hypothetical protein
MVVFDTKKMIIFSAVNLLQFLVIKTLDPYWIRIRIGIQPRMLDPDQMNAYGSETLIFLLEEGYCSKQDVFLMIFWVVSFLTLVFMPTLVI